MRNLIFIIFLLVTTTSHAQSIGNGCLLIAVNESQRQTFSQAGQVPGFQSGCLVAQQDSHTVYIWDGNQYQPVGSGGVTSLNSLVGSLNLLAGTGISITPSGSNITITNTGGAAGANTFLSNLTSPTALNQDLIFNEGTNAQILTANSSSGPTANLNMKTGDGTGQNSGSFSIGAGNSDTQSGGVVEFSGGNVTSATANESNGGDVSIFGGNTASVNASAEGGSIMLAAGSAPIPTNSGAVSIYDGNGLAGINIGPNIGVNILDNSGVQGAQFFSTDRELDDSTGSPALQFASNLVLLRSSPNLIQFQNGSQGTAGYIWTSTDTNGSGTWMPASGGSPGGSNTQIQFNDSGVFNGNGALLFDKTTGTFSTQIINILNGSTPVFSESYATGTITQKTVDDIVGSKNISVSTGNVASGSNVSGFLHSITGTSVDGQSGEVLLGTGDTSGNGSSGPVGLFTGSARGSGSASSANITIQTGDVPSGTGASGSISFLTGLSSANTSGDVTFGTEGFGGSGTQGRVVFQDMHLSTEISNTIPAVAVQSHAGTGSTCTIASFTDTAGQITISSGTAGISTGAYCILTFGAPYVSTPTCTLTAGNSSAALIVGPYVTSNSSSMTINFAVAAGISTTYILNYHCIETP